MEEDRRIVVAKGVDAFDITLWEEARRTDPERLAWICIGAQAEQKSGTIDVTLGVSQDAYDTLSAGLAHESEIAEAIACSLGEEAQQIIEEDHWRQEAEDIPIHGPSDVFGACTLVMEWVHWQAVAVSEMARASVGDVGCVELRRVGPVGRTTITVAVSVPPAIFDDAMARYGAGRLGDDMCDCLFDAIRAAGASKRQVKPTFSEDEIPF